MFGIVGIPMRWTSVVHGRVPGMDDRRWDLAALQHLAATLDGSTKGPYEAPATDRIEPREIVDGVWAADLDGARYSASDFAVVSLCRTGTPFSHATQRCAYLTDDDENPDLDRVLNDVLDDMEALRADGREVLVHCHGGASRTGFILRGWLIRTKGLSVEGATERVAGRWPHLGLWNVSFTEALHRLAERNRRGEGE
ncbi:MAG: dual specificity protein phosphatase family protein [Actinomycetota bacterium]|nr:dual specificity protein phosphatase family protein [Actinomycetota bacterium]